jgi:hypothetical protein
MRFAMFLRFVSVVLVSMILVSTAAGETPAAKWEYAEFSISRASGREFDDFQGGGKAFHGNSLAELYKSMTGKAPVKRRTDQPSDCLPLDILDAAGAMGWELVTLDKSLTNLTIYTFKRPSL